MTLNDFYTRVLRKLRVVPPNGTALAEDRQRIVDVYPQVHATMLEVDLVRWAATEAIPDKYVIPMVAIVAYQVAEDFSLPTEDLLRLKVEGSLLEEMPSLAERQLKKLLAEEYVSAPLPTNYF